MKAGLMGVTAFSLSLILLPVPYYLPTALAQSMSAPLVTSAQLDQLLAPIALYPDPLLSQILMASTYPLEIVQAERWLEGLHNAPLRGDQLDQALQQQDWDPSVKALIQFPQIIQLMNNKLDWTQALGNAFLVQQTDVMDSVQRLRYQAQAAGSLQSTAQAQVSTQGQIIVIEPVNPDLIYVPYYDPRRVYGTWGYTNYPPVYFPPPPNYASSGVPILYFGVGFGVIGTLWGWNHWDWDHHNISVDPDRYNRINTYVIEHDNRPRSTSNTWQHDPVHRRDVPYNAPEVRQKFPQAPVGTPDAHRDFRGFDHSRSEETHGTIPAVPERAPPPVSVAHPTPPPPLPAVQRPQVLPPVQRPQAPAFIREGNAPDVRTQSQRGQSSRQANHPDTSAPQAAAPQQRAAPQNSPQPQQAPRPAQPPPQPPPQQQQQQHSPPAETGHKGDDHDKQHH